MTRSLLAVAALLFAACATQTSGVAPDPEPKHAKRPFTAEEIRHSMPLGTEISIKVEQPGVDPIVRVMRVVECDDAKLSLEHTTTNVKGDTLGEPGLTEQTWTGLMEHATFPKYATRIEETTITTDLGTFDAWLYVIDEPGPDQEQSTRLYWFAKTLPGPPVKFETRQGEQTMMLATMTARSSPEPEKVDSEKVEPVTP